MKESALDRNQAIRAYSRMTGVLGVVRFYEQFATNRLAAHARLESAHAVLEFGCGTGHFARQLLGDYLGPDARYKAIDVTPEMVAATRNRLAAFGSRVVVVQSDGGAPDSEAPASYDRFISNFVLDLLPQQEIDAVIAAAHRVLVADGLLCLSSLAPAQGPVSRRIMGIWDQVYRRAPSLVGGCRPIPLRQLLDEQQWSVIHAETVAPLGIPLEVVIASKR